MCGRISTPSGRQVKVGSNVGLGVTVNGEERVVKFKGFATRERLDSYWLNFGSAVKIQVKKYFDGNVGFDVPTGKVWALVIEAPVGNYKKDDMLLITRPAETDREARIHDRHPVFAS